MKFILGTKEGMSQIFSEDGKLTPVTLIKVTPNVVIQVKTKEKDGYEAVQIGTGNTRKLSKGLKGHFNERGSFAHVREFPSADASTSSAQGAGQTPLKVGDKVGIEQFEVGDKVKVTCMTKGKGFAGVVKRHGFAGAPASHGHKKVLRRPGSIGGRFPQHVRKGLRMAGRDGYDRVAARNLTVVVIDAEEGVLALKGAVPGTRGRLVEITSK
jgi:large subunit ribosomal protein L3